MKYIPQQGDIINISLDPRLGHEQKGRRPGLIVSNADYHKHTNNMALVCPITNAANKFPMHVTLDERNKTTGEIMCEQILCVDLNARKVDFVEFVPNDIMDEVIDIICSSIE
jgi:mRNA interferase MazF